MNNSVASMMFFSASFDVLPWLHKFSAGQYETYMPGFSLEIVAVSDAFSEMVFLAPITFIDWLEMALDMIFPQLVGWQFYQSNDPCQAACFNAVALMIPLQGVRGGLYLGHHVHQAIGASRRKMFLESDLVDEIKIRLANLLYRLVGQHANQ